MRTEFLPTTYNTYRLGTDYSTIAAFLAAKVTGKDMRTTSEGLIIPDGADHTETITAGNAPLEMEPLNSDATGFPFIVGETINAKPSVNFDIAEPNGACCFQLKGNHYSLFADVEVSFETAQTATNFSGVQIYAASGASYGKIIGCAVKDMLLPNAVSAGGAGGFAALSSSGGGQILDCAFDITGTLTKGSIDAVLGVYVDGSVAPTLANITATRNDFTFQFGTLINATAINCIVQNAASANFVALAGAWTKTTCLDGAGVTFNSDGYHVPDNSEIGSGTDVSAIITQDIDGDTFSTNTIGADYYTVPVSPSTKRSNTRLGMGMAL